MVLAAVRVTGASAAWEIADKLCCCPDKVVDVCGLFVSRDRSVLPKGDFALFACNMLSAFRGMDSATCQVHDTSNGVVQQQLQIGLPA